MKKKIKRKLKSLGIFTIGIIITVIVMLMFSGCNSGKVELVDLPVVVLNKSKTEFRGSTRYYLYVSDRTITTWASCSYNSYTKYQINDTIKNCSLIYK